MHTINQSMNPGVGDLQSLGYCTSVESDLIVRRAAKFEDIGCELRIHAIYDCIICEFILLQLH